MRFLTMANSFLSLTVQSVDPALGRLDYDSLSDQTLMEMLVSTLSEESKAAYQDENGAFTDIEEWAGIVCDSHGTVTEICLDDGSTDALTGSLSFQFTPPSTQRIDFSYQHSLQGTLTTSLLPVCLKYLDITHTRICGPFDLTSLPMALEELDITENNFSGSALWRSGDLSALPSGLTHIYAYGNSFSGSINLSKLPPKLVHLNLSRNKLSGEVEFSNLPDSLVTVCLQFNGLSGSIAMRDFHHRKVEINLSFNAFSGTAVVSKDFSRVRVGGWASRVTAVIDESGNPHPQERRILRQETYLM